MTRPKVYAITCTANGWVHKNLAVAWMKILQDGRFDTRLSFPVHKPFENALHHAVVEFLAADAEWFLNIDSDQWPTTNPLELIERNHDICGVATPVYHCDATKPGDRPWYLNAYRRVEGGYHEWQPQGGIQEVDGVGTGCILIHRRVLDDPVLRVAPFRRTTDLAGRVEYGNDLAFCQRAKERGFRIWCDFRSPCEHLVELPLLEAIRAFHEIR